MAQSVNNLLVMLLLVCGTRAQNNTFNVTQFPRSTNVTLLEGDNAFLSFVMVNDPNVRVTQKIITYYKNSVVDDPKNYKYNFSKTGVPLLNKTEETDVYSAHWPFTTDGVQYVEHIMRVAYGKQLTNVSRLNIQFELVDSCNSLRHEIITFNVMLMSATTSESSRVGCTTTVQPTVTRDPILDATSAPPISSTPQQNLASSLNTNSNGPFDSGSDSAYPDPTTTSSKFHPSASVSSSVYHTQIPSSSAQPITIGLSVSGTVILIVVIIVVAFAIYFACRVNNGRAAVEQMDREQRVTENEGSEETSNLNSIKTTHDIFSNNDSGNLSFKNSTALQRDNGVDSEEEKEEEL